MSEISDQYQYRISWLEDDGEHVGQCLEFPSLSWLASTSEEAFTGIRDLVREIVEDMRINGEAIPQPMAVKEYSGKFQVRVPSELHRRLAMRAAENGVSLNLYVNSKLMAN